MNKLLRAGLAVALCTGAAACASKPPPPVVEAPPPPPPPPAPPPAVTTFDGVYRGVFTRVNSPKTCVASHHSTIRVMNGAFSLAFSKTVSFDGVQVGQDGSFGAASGDNSLKGMLADHKATGTLDGAACHYTFTMAEPLHHGMRKAKSAS